MERAVEYPMIDELEVECGYELDREWMLRAAFPLACPLKANPPNWQHGRVIYSLLRRRLEDSECEGVILDIGTAKGFSACVMAKALNDTSEDMHGFDPTQFQIVSTDVIHPNARVRRNSVLELDGMRTLGEFVRPFIKNAADVSFRGDGSVATLHDLFKRQGLRIPFAFIDGKHSYDVVNWEHAAISKYQKSGDIIVFDDTQIPGVLKAVNHVDQIRYSVKHVKVLHNRSYAVAERY